MLNKTFPASLCPINNLFGVSCFGCGMTRGFISILNLDFKAAYKFNVLSIPLFIGIALYSVFSLTDIIFDKNYIFIIEKQLSKKYMFLIYAMILILTIILT